MRPKDLPDRDLLLSLLDYDPMTGILTHRPRPREMFPNERLFRAFNAYWPGRAAGNISPGDVTVCVNRIQYRAHRLIWLMVNGEPVPDEVDHKDTDPHNNRIDNLRAADAFFNKANTGLWKHNTSGFKGASRLYNGRWRASIQFGGKSINLGHFDTAEGAAEARRKAAEELFREFARHE